jgi:hypothetical protein
MRFIQSPGTSGVKVMRSAVLCAAVIMGVVVPECAGAADLTGAWASDADRCEKVFVRRGRAKQIGFAKFSGVYGGGFVIEADRLKGKFANCTIKARKEEGEQVNLIAACATDIMLSDVQFVLKIVDDDNMTRIFPGIEGVEVKYHRCRL